MNKKNQSANDNSEFQKQYSEMVKSVMDLSIPEVMKWVRDKFPLFTPGQQFDYKFYDKMPHPTLQIEITYRESVYDNTIMLMITLGEPDTEGLKTFTYSNEF